MAFFNRDGLTLYYEDRGVGDVLVFIHGLGSSTLDWEDQLRYFEQGYRVIAIDVRGHGRSDKPIQAYTIPLFASDVWALIDHLGISSFSLVGLSMGGMISFQMSTEQPDRIERLIVINSAPEFLNDSLTVKQFIRQRKFVIRWFGFRYFCKLMGERLFPDADQEQLRKKFLERWLKNEKKPYKLAFNALINWGVTARLNRINCPVLVMGAEMDYTTEEFKLGYTRKLTHGSYVRIDGSRHMSTLDQPAQVNALIEKFLLTHQLEAKYSQKVER
jgi:3-oxoadipate enol-lactonase